MNINRVIQKDNSGCVIACIAMVTGQSYNTVRAGFLNLSPSGISEWQARDYLAEHGYACAVKYPYYSPIEKKRDIYPPPPFAQIHIVFTFNHSVVMLADGTVIDPSPYKNDLYKLSDYDKIGVVIGIVKINR